MFTPKTEKIQKLAERFPNVIVQLEKVFDKPTNVYIDFANVKHWQNKLGWRIDLKRLKQFLNSFDTIRAVKFYYGILKENKEENKFIKIAEQCEYEIKTKPVKIMKISIDVSSIDENSPSVLENFISKPLFHKLDLESVEFLNGKLRDLNQRGIKFLEILKCNFDVEIGRDMLIDYNNNHIENFILWSGDSDFADPVEQLIADGKKVAIFAIARRIAVELGKTEAQIFDIRRIKEFICWKKDLPEELGGL